MAYENIKRLPSEASVDHDHEALLHVIMSTSEKNAFMHSANDEKVSNEAEVFRHEVIMDLVF